MAQAPTSNAPYSTEASQEEKARLLREQDRAINTRVAYGNVLDPSLGGRFAKEVKADFTIGRDARVEYPRLPSNSPWSQQQPPNEEPFNVDIQYVEPCGTEEEIERSLLSAAIEPVGPSPADSAEVLSPPSADPAPTIGALAPGVVGADPSSSLAGPTSSDSRDQPTGPPSGTPADRVCEGKRDVRVEPAVSREGTFPTWRRIGNAG